MKTKIYIATFLFVCTLISCKKETFTDYKFADKPIALPCNNLDSKLYNEALLSFEKDILNFFGKDNKTNLRISYSRFLRLASYNRVDYKKIVSEHSLKVFEAIKNDTDLWETNNTATHLNYHGKLMDCISKNVKSADLKTTLNALLTTNSMSAKLFSAPIASNYNAVINDKALACYVAFDLYYAKLFDVDFSKPESTTK
ncbi:hypothetical protein [Yeosuana marina]|uniref:hypothetical protein n=1 Tax=Yeosuana marina TaxID=1565536 RepID=UPI00141E11FD|nr:hypothetical protein [Yeosuana marina]